MGYNFSYIHILPQQQSCRFGEKGPVSDGNFDDDVLEAESV